MANRGCNLECVKGKLDDNVREFIGPVKIVLVDEPNSVYMNRKCQAAAIVLAQMMMAVTTLTAMLYSMSYKQKYWLNALHIFLCTIGFQACIPSSILSLNSLSGSAAPMRVHDRQVEHIMLGTFGLVCTLLGMIALLYLNTLTLFTIHSLSGVVANVAFLLCGVTGLYLVKYCGGKISSEDLEIFDKHVYLIHRISGLLGVLAASICFMTGVMLLPFKKWLPLEEMYYITILFCILCTIIIIYKPLKELF